MGSTNSTGTAVEPSPVRSVDDSTLVTFELRVNRTDLAGNHLPAPERWSLEDAAEADRLGLIYDFALTLRDDIRP